jgi:hypothetical protein
MWEPDHRAAADRRGSGTQTSRIGSDSPFHNGSSRIKVGLVGRSDSQFDLLFEAAIGSSDGSQAALRPL